MARTTHLGWAKSRGDSDLYYKFWLGCNLTCAFYYTFRLRRFRGRPLRGVGLLASGGRRCLLLGHPRRLRGRALHSSLLVHWVGSAPPLRLCLELLRGLDRPPPVALTTTTLFRPCGRMRLVVVPMFAGCSRR